MRCPHELDVYLIPHLRMKNVIIYCLELIDLTDFSDQQNVEIMYAVLQSAFSLLKSHEMIEDTIILQRLRKKILDQSGDTSIIDQCHNERIIDKFLDIIRGIVKRDRTFNDWQSHRDFLVSSLADFQSLFNPHMKSEENMFLPLLRRFMGYDELRVVHKTVIKYHDLVQPRIETIDSYKKTKEAYIRGQFIDILPTEILIEIFKLLPRSCLLSMSSVCKRWRRLTLCPQLWTFFDLKPHLSAYSIPGLLKFVIPMVRFSVVGLSLSNCEDIDDKMATRFLSLCPLVQDLDLSYTCVTDQLFLNFFSHSKSLSQLKSLNLSRCAQITDVALQTMRGTHLKSLENLDLSGCELITDSGLLSLVSSDDGLESPLILKKLKSLNLSGCRLLTRPCLVKFVESCPRLVPEHLYYCSMIHDGPFPRLANGCTNACPFLCGFTENDFI